MRYSLHHLRNPSSALAIVGLLALLSATPISAETLYSSGFDNFAALAGEGWDFQNNSNPIGVLGYGQGVPAVFNAAEGSANSYMYVNFGSTGDNGDISNWAITPTITYQNGDTFSFLTRSSGIFADRVEVRMSLAGSSGDVGTTTTSVGDFGISLLTINEVLDPNGYPNTWTQYIATVSGLASPTSGRIAFRYAVPDGGFLGTNSYFVGIDSLNILRGEAPPPPPPPPTPISVAGSATGTLAAGEIDWYSFVNPGGILTIDTLGSTLGTTPNENDTEIAVYDAAGNLLGENDDIDFDADNFLSALTGTLITGDTYYIAVGAFDSVFDNQFIATSTSAITGTYQLNIVTTVPEPGTVVLLGMGFCAIGCLAARRKLAA
ncbi:MAG: PEP-CTERM sorting domain-containing protein [Akkermansiaceae bacterium]|nr:PEP-CTERM sorting domain-containing protein [Armatimonadota bacterium]